MKLPELWIFTLLFYSVSSNLYSSIVGMEKLLQTEKSIIQIFQSFILKTEQQIAGLKRYIERLEQERKKTTDSSKTLNSFYVAKRIIEEWGGIENILSVDFSQEAKKYISELKSSKYFPTVEDLTGSANAINRISDTYNIDISSLANGKINGIQYPSQLSADDCYEIGMHSFTQDQYHFAYSWMDEAFKRFHKEANINDTFIEKSLEIKAYSAHKLGNFHSALNITTELLKHYPNNTDAASNIAYYITKLNREEVKKIEKEKNKKSEHKWEKEYKEICRQPISLPVQITSQLKCRYINNDIPFLRLAPMKEEEAFLNPRIVLFKDALYDSEIEIIKELAIPKLEIATVGNSSGGIHIISKNRIAQRSWLSDNEHPMMRTILLRAEDMTKLDISKTEPLQVINYGVGGYYGTHSDYVLRHGKRVMEIGDRIATLLYYMNNVKQGGATAFPFLRFGLWPEKGTAVLWYNLSPDGKQDERTVHASCPVVAGTKWISTKWFHEKGQEFRRPCELKQ